MLQLLFTKRFEKQRELAKRRGKSMEELTEVVKLLRAGKPLPVKYRNHRLKGDYVGYWECHITPDWLLIYAKDNDCLLLVETGSHSDLF